MVTNANDMDTEIRINESAYESTHFDIEIYPHNLSLLNQYINTIHHLTMSVGIQKGATTSTNGSTSISMISWLDQITFSLNMQLCDFEAFVATDCFFSPSSSLFGSFVARY